jgi:hypothetical protein
MHTLKLTVLIPAAILSLLQFNTALAAELMCVDSKGSAAIIDNDLPSARIEAIARARWAAIESAVGVTVSAQSIVQNAVLLDDMVNAQAKGFISNHRVLEEKREGTVFNVTVNACVEPSKAAEAVSSLALNRSVAVFVPARQPKMRTELESTSVTQGTQTARNILRSADEHEESNIFSENLISQLIDKGFTVTDITSSKSFDAEAADKALKSGNYFSLKSLVSKYLSNVLLIGKIDYTVSQKKGDDIGYGIDMPFNNVTVRLTYRLISRSQYTDQFTILGAGTANAQGFAASLEDATSKGLHTLSNNVIPSIIDKFTKYIKDASNKITVTVDGMEGVEKTFDIKMALNGISWVSSVDAISLNEFIVNYPENSLYLANSLSRNPHLKLESYSPNLIRLSYRK